jgi:triacylglycerol lipase
MNNRRQVMASLAACLILLSGCAGTSKSELQSLGSTITPVSVNFGEIQSYAARSRAAYNPEAAFRSIYPATVRVSAPGNSATLYFLERDDKQRTQTITVRGTADKKNFSEDLEIKIRTDRTLDIPVDSGFDTVAAALYADMKPYLKPGYRTYLTGHSLGGAVAVLLAVYMSEDGHKVERIVTFGQPKFTTAAGAQRLDFLPLTRVVDENDMVPMLPPASFRNLGRGSYEHVGPEVVLLEGPEYAYLPRHDAERLSVGEAWLR